LRLRNRDVPKLERERGGVDQCFHDGDLQARTAGHKKSGVPLSRRPGTPQARTGSIREIGGENQPGGGAMSGIPDPSFRLSTSLSRTISLQIESIWSKESAV
jgi:hypothetical protein